MEKNHTKFQRMNLSEYAGLCIGLIDGKIAFKNKDPKIVLKRLLSLKDDKEISCICVPSKKTAMAI